MNKDLVRTIYTNYYLDRTSRNVKLLFEAYNFFSTSPKEVTNCNTCIMKLKSEFESYLNQP